MRVLISRQRDDSGAIAILVALLAVVLIGMLAFTADIGVAYANKRQMQNAADAAALGAAGVFAQQPGRDCASILASGSVAAGDEAETLETANQPVSGTSDLILPPATSPTLLPAAECAPEGLVTRATVGGATPLFFGGLFGADNGYDVLRSAAAVVEAATSVGAGLRPLAVCSRDIASLTTFPSTVMKLEFPESGQSSTACPDSEQPGNWWTLDCPEDGGNDLEQNIEIGCSSSVSIVPGQPSPTTGTFLNGYCDDVPLHKESCLRANPGNVRSNGVGDAFEGLVTSGETFFLPVFCGPPTCSPSGVSDDGGGNVIYAVHKLVAVQLCGYHFGNSQKSARSDMYGDCADTPAINPMSYDPDFGGPHANYLLAVVKQVQVSGGTTPSGCRIGDPCDTGLRQVRMVDGGFTY